ncbi:hypothetical protein KIL84_001019 [Mauremys mutica]|uniref:Uncharacterized protein n=1 Tax=Mauremys mutica TaxID=74926 RepID=A0A9D3WTR1_9SAUR|nr:hypothetical protein KIL84_001019 [Mauremys mutica]
MFAIHTVSKTLQSREMQLDLAITHIKGLIDFLRKYRNTGFTSAKNTATEIAAEMDVEHKFRERHVKRKRGEEELENSPEKVFETNYFLVILDQALVSLITGFEQIQEYVWFPV